MDERRTWTIDQRRGLISSGPQPFVIDPRRLLMTCQVQDGGKELTVYYWPILLANKPWCVIGDFLSHFVRAADHFELSVDRARMQRTREQVAVEPERERARQIDQEEERKRIRKQRKADAELAHKEAAQAHEEIGRHGE